MLVAKGFGIKRSGMKITNEGEAARIPLGSLTD